MLFVGYQPEGTRGRRLLQGEQELKVPGRFVKVRAAVMQFSGFSARADWKEMLRSAQSLLVHGEPDALEGMRARVAERGWAAHVPGYLDTVPLAAGPAA